MSKRIAVIGAFDRYNYGDLLFPIVIEHYVTSRDKDFVLDFFGLKRAKMTRFGGKDTHPTGRLLRTRARMYDALLVAGGAVAGVRWNGMFLSLCRSRLSYRSSKAFFRAFKKTRDSFARSRFVERRISRG